MAHVGSFVARVSNGSGSVIPHRGSMNQARLLGVGLPVLALLLTGCGTMPPFYAFPEGAVLGVDTGGTTHGPPPPPSISVRRVGKPSLGSSTGSISVYLDPRLGSGVGELKDGGTIEISFWSGSDVWSGTYTFGSADTDALDASMSSHAEHKITIDVAKGGSLGATESLKMVLTFTFEDSSSPWTPPVSRLLNWECIVEKW